MSLCGFSSNEDYLSAALEFLTLYQWIFRHKNTDILTKKVLESFPERWREFFERLPYDDLNRLISGEFRDDTPEDLKAFFETIDLLKLKSNGTPMVAVDNLKTTGLSKKKAHEIALLAPVIHDTCQSTGCDLIVDIGSGVGHLPHLLFTKYNYPILALEASKKLVQTGRDKLHNTPIIFEELYVQESSACTIQHLVQTHFGLNKKICLTGLHACADLSVEVQKLFAKIPNAHAMVIMPCCYHRMTSDVKYFKSFPCSALGTSLFDKYDVSGFVGQPFLRLACQRTVKSFVGMSSGEHERHARLLMQRALLQLVAEMENCSVRRLKRKSGKSDSEDGFESYLNNLPKTHRLVPHQAECEVNWALFSQKMREKWPRNDVRRAEVLAGLQAAIQAVCENVILVDRVAFLKEKGLHCCVRKITNDCVSPRCWALIALKNVRVQ